MGFITLSFKFLLSILMCDTFHPNAYSIIVCIVIYKLSNINVKRKWMNIL